MKARVDGMSFADCRKVYGRERVTLDFTRSEVQTCAGGIEGQNSCTAHQGAPLMDIDDKIQKYTYYYLVGLASFGHNPCGKLFETKC